MVSERFGLFRSRIGLQRLCGFGNQERSAEEARLHLHLVHKLMDFFGDPVKFGLD